MTTGAAAVPPLLQARGVCKDYPGVRALSQVDFTVRAGEVVALVGENGAGKSTLMKALAGVVQPHAGQILLAGAPVRLAGPADALSAGIALIHQELSLCDNLTVAGALFLGAELRRGPFLRLGAMRAQAAKWLDRVGLQVDADTPVSALAPGQKQLLEIARALRAQARVLIMDEPTSSLTMAETARLYAVVRELRGQGVGVVYISHRLGEVKELADRVVGLRDGRNSGELSRDAITHEALVGLMVGRKLATARRAAHAPGDVVLRVAGLRTRAFPGAAVGLQVRQREIVGIAGLLGSGRTELLRALVGVDERLGGAIEVAGAPLRAGGPAAAASAGLVLLPEDRKAQGLVLGMTVRENVSLPTLRRRGVLVDRVYERDLATRAIAQLAVAASGPEQPVGTLSGGNQQKVVFGKWLAAAPKVLLLDEPTRGVDVGARAEIYARLHALAADGLAVVFVSSDLEEVLALADRVLVMRGGAVQAELVGDRLTERDVMLAATSMEAG
ncbi:MAG: sugar ABC transporter ATP-binding protein [Planctomycetes bacterium]|nr:sugar ABC transporter ATP-binding protein [Planctomycetota bacterium]